MRNSKTPNYGYKVCYREEGAKEYVRYFLSTPESRLSTRCGVTYAIPRLRGTATENSSTQNGKSFPYRKKKSNAVYGESVRFSGHSLSHRRRTR